LDSLLLISVESLMPQVIVAQAGDELLALEK
jgi:hypothetical protein